MMRKRLLNQQNLTRRLGRLSVLFALLQMPIGTWAQDISVAGYMADANGDFSGVNITTGTVHFDAPTSTLTLTGATITGNISTTLGNLTINLVGSNTLNGCISNEEDYEYTSLSFTGNGSLGITGAEGVFNDIESYELASGLYLASDSPAPYCDGSSLRGADGNEVSNITISANVTYPVWVYTGGQTTDYTQLTATTNSVNGTSGTASYNGNLLTLTNFDCNTTGGGYAFYIGREMDQLTVNLSGSSTITGAGFYFANNDATLTFTKGETDGSLQVQDGQMATCSDGIPSIACENGLVLNDRTVSTGGIRIDIADYPFTESGSLYEGKVSYDASTNTLTINDGLTIGSATASSDITVYVDHLIVELNGESRIYGNIQYASANQSSSIQINKADGATSANLTLSDVSGFGSCTWGDGLYLSAQDAQGATIDVHYEHFEGEGGAMQSYYGNNIAEVFFSTTETNAIWVAGNMSTGGNITGEGIEGTVTYNADDRILTIDNAFISTSEDHPSPLIVCNGDLTVKLVGSNGTYFNGDYSTYIFKNNTATGTLTFTGNGSLGITSAHSEGTYIGLCDGFSTVDFGDLTYTVNGDTKFISPLNISTPMMNVHEGKIEFITDGYLFGSTTYYKIVYADGSGNEEEVPLTNSDWSNYNEKITISELTGPCTVYAYTKYNDETGNSAKAKLFGPAEEIQRIVYGETASLAIAPAIEDGDGIKISGIEANNLSYDSETGEVTGTTIGSTSFPVPLSYTSESGNYMPGNTFILNYSNFEMQVEVVPPAPTISLEAGTYLSTHDPITITRTGLDNTTNTTIKYKWDDGTAQTYSEAIPVQNGTLTAWVEYSDGTTTVSSDETSVEYTVNTDIATLYVAPVEDVPYTGSAVTPTIVVKATEDAEASLTAGTDYTVSYKQGETAVAAANLINRGTYTAVLAGAGNYGGTKEVTFKIGKGVATITAENQTTTFTGSEIAFDKSNITLTPSTLSKDGIGFSYTIPNPEDPDNPEEEIVLDDAPTNAGTYTVYIYLTDDNYEADEVVKTLTISPKSLTEGMVTLSAESFQYNGETQKPNVTVADGTFMTTSDYTITNNGGQTVGSYDVVVTGQGNYTGEVTKSFSIVNRTLAVGANGDVQFADGQTWASFYTTTESLELPEGLMAYIVTGVSETSATLKAIKYVPQNVPVFLEYNSTETTENTSADGNLLLGTTAATAVSSLYGTIYGLHNNKLMQVTSGSIPAGRAYLAVNVPAHARELTMIKESEATGISDALHLNDSGELNDDQWFDMTGRKLLNKPSKKGFYIKNGKKVFVNNK